MEGLNLRIDGDTIVYRAGFASDARDGDVSHSLHNVKLIMGALRSKFPDGTMSTYLTSTLNSDNFRFSIAPNYKGNRAKKCRKCSNKEGFTEIGIIHTENKDGTTARFRGFECDLCKEVLKGSKPVYYQEIRDYLVDKYDAVVCDWGEADDWLGIDADTSNTVIASNDKDLLMVPCWHYRISANKLLRGHDPGQLWLSTDKKKMLGVGFKWFCAQMLLGDKVDNIIKPKKGDGNVFVHKLLQGNDDIVSLWETVKYYYKAVDKEDMIAINSKLLWMSREARQIFDEGIVYDERKWAIAAS